MRMQLHASPPRAPPRLPHLVDPVRVEQAAAADLAADALLSHRAQVARRLELRDTGARGLAVHDALRVMARARTASMGVR
jgi:hypothetical protein